MDFLHAQISELQESVKFLKRTVDFHSLSCCPLFVPDSISSSVVMRFLSLAPACHCFKPRGTPRHDVKFKCCSLGQAFRAFLKRETESERKEENDHLRVEMSWNNYCFHLLVTNVFRILNWLVMKLKLNLNNQTLT